VRWSTSAAVHQDLGYAVRDGGVGASALEHKRCCAEHHQPQAIGAELQTGVFLLTGCRDKGK